MAETESNVCSICLEPIQENADRGMARLGCKHFFHLDCIGSQFNYRGGEMACPNCRVVERGQWLYSRAESLQQQEERQEQEQQEQQPLQHLLEYIYEVFSNQHPEQLEQLINDIYSNFEDPQEHFHLVMPTGHYWCPNGGFHLHPPLPPSPPPILALPARRMRRFGRATEYRNQLRARIGIAPRDRQAGRLNYERVIVTHPNSGAARLAPYPIRQQRQPNNFSSPALNMPLMPAMQPPPENISPPRARSHQRSLSGSVFQSQPIGSCPFSTRGRLISQGDLFVLQFNI